MGKKPRVLRERWAKAQYNEEDRVKRTGSDDSLRCSFCHKSQHAVGKLISSPSDYPRAYICDECIAVCNSILEDDRAGEQEPAESGPKGAAPAK